MVVSWQILEQETSISRRRSLAVVAKVRGGKRTSRALHRAANAGRVVPTTPRRRRRQRELDIHRGFRIEPPSTIARRRGPVRSQPHTERPAAQPRTAARCCVPGSWAGRDIKSQRTSGGGGLLGATKKLELPGSCQLKRRPSQSQSRGKDDGWMRCAIFCHRPVVFCVVVGMDILCF